MKARNIHIESDADLDRLLEAYYEGNASQEQEAAIALYLASLAAIPEKYAADAALFKAIAAERVAVEATPVPEGLADRIARATYGCTRRARFIAYLKVASIAAAIALLMVVAVKMQRREPVADRVQLYSAAELRPDSVTVHVDVAEAQEESPKPEDVKPTKPTVPVAVAKAAPVPDPYEEITDSATVASIMEEVIGKLDSTLAMADAGVHKTDLALNSIPETINKVLDK